MNVLKDWSVRRDPFLAPEHGSSICGTVVSHGVFPIGKEITTSTIVSSDPVKRTVTTHSGTVYVLSGPPNKKLTQYLIKHHPGMDSFPKIIRIQP